MQVTLAMSFLLFCISLSYISDFAEPYLQLIFLANC